MGTIRTRQDTVQHPQYPVSTPRPHGATAERNQPVPAMDACIYIRLPAQLLDDMRERAKAEGPTAAEWVRRRIARALNQPVPPGRGRGRRRPAPGDDLLALISDQEAIAEIGIALREVIAGGEAAWVSPDWVRTQVATVLAKLEDLSGVLVQQIERARR